MTREELIHKVQRCSPGLGWEFKYPNLYGKYGMTISGIYEGWYWFTEDNIADYARARGCLPLTEATDTELLEMWAMADNYWLNKYEKWYEESKNKSAKLDRFIGECERRYFEYDADGYTDKTIDRIFNSIFEVLDKSAKEKTND